MTPGFGRSPWRREWLPTPVFWPGESGMDFSPGGHKQSDMTKRLSLHLTGCHKNSPKQLMVTKEKKDAGRRNKLGLWD